MAVKLEHTEYGFVKDKGLQKCYCTVSSIKNERGGSWRPSAYGRTKRIAREKLEAKLDKKALELEEAAKADTENRTEPKPDGSSTLVEQLKV